MQFQNENIQCCGTGGRLANTLKPFPDPYAEIRLLLTSNNIESSEFRANIRRYNNVLAFSAVNANYDRTLATSNRGFYSYRISGQIRHTINNIHTQRPSTLADTYLFDPDDQICDRMSQNSELNMNLVQQVQDQLIRRLCPDQD